MGFLIVALSSTIAGLVVGMFFGLMKFEMFVEMAVGLSVGLGGGLLYGGLPAIQHYVLRLLLSRNNYLPWKLVPFLDYCTDLIFLHRVGGGYIFVHRLLMEHFAAMAAEG